MSVEFELVAWGVITAVFVLLVREFDDEKQFAANVLCGICSILALCRFGYLYANYLGVWSP